MSTERVFAFVALGISCCWIASIVSTLSHIETSSGTTLLLEPRLKKSFVVNRNEAPEFLLIKAGTSAEDDDEKEVALNVSTRAMEFDAEIEEFRRLGLVPPRPESWRRFRRERVVELAKEEQQLTLQEEPRISAATVVDVFVDWPRSTFLFSSYNYAALESLLSLSGAARVTALVVGPTKTSSYRYSNANSFVQFERYKKLGHVVDTEVVNAASILYGSSGKGGPGSAWWKSHRRSCCPPNVDFATFFARDDLDVVPSPAVILFLRLQKLWLSGGWFVDFDLFWLKNPVSGTRGFNLGCASTTETLPSMILAFPSKRDASLACVLAKFDECGADDACSSALATSGARAAFQDCFDLQPNDLSGIVEWFDCDNDRARKFLFGDPGDEGFDVEGALALWLGPDATDGAWREPSPQSFFSRVLSPRLATFRVADRSCARWLRADRERSYEKNNNGSSRTVLCPRFRPGLAGLSSHFSRRDQRLAEQNCAPRIFIPAAQKGASSYLFSLLMTHPQTLPPLRGAQYKEPGAYANAVYYRQPFSKRVSRFPFVRPNEGLVSLDGTVSYAIESRLPAFRIALDSPSAKFVFALREPVDRSFSDYRFCYRPFFQDTDLSWDDAILQLIPLYDTCFDNKTSSVENFYEATPCRRADRYGLIRKSLYYFQVAFFGQVFGKDNILVVTSEQLKADAPAVGRRAAQFAGLCPFDFAPIPPVHVTQLQPAPRHFWSKPVYYKLRAWFEPYNHRLFTYINANSEDLGWTPVREPTNFRPSR